MFVTVLDLALKEQQMKRRKRIMPSNSIIRLEKNQSAIVVSDDRKIEVYLNQYLNDESDDSTESTKLVTLFAFLVRDKEFSDKLFNGMIECIDAMNDGYDAGFEHAKKKMAFKLIKTEEKEDDNHG
jgi:hypothetical protein